MASLIDVYEREVGEIASRRRVYFGLSLFVVGVVMAVGSIVVATTSLGQQLGFGVYEARELAGVLAGLGIPAVFLGSFTLLPASRRLWAGAVIGTGLSVLGVTLFREAYPVQWLGSAASRPELTLPVVVVYFLGTITTFWCLFLAIANLNTRNDPGGTVTMQVTEEGTTVFEVDGTTPDAGSEGSLSGLGSVGMFGTNPDGDVETQTNEEPLYTRTDSATAEQSRTRTAASDGGSATHPGDGGPASGGHSTDEELIDAIQTRRQPDTYCGNCEHFQYVRVNDTMQPACTLHSDIMDDMDACDEWSANN